MNKSWKWLRTGLYASTLIGALATSPSHAEQIGMESSSGSSSLGMTAQALTPHWAENGVDVQLSLDQTLTRSLLKIALGRLDAAIIPPLAYSALQKGAGPYKELGDSASDAAANVRSLFGVPTSLYHAITWADDGIRSWPDAKNERIYIGPPGGAANAQIIALIEAGGLQEGNYTTVKAPWGAATNGFRDGQYDVYVGVFGMGSQGLAELSMSRDIYLLSVGEVEPPEGQGLQLAEIPPNTYPGQTNEESVYTWQVLQMMSVHQDMPEETAYKLTKTYLEYRGQIAKNNTTLSHLANADPFAGLNAPLHPGAVRYYEEVGMAIPEKLLSQ